MKDFIREILLDKKRALESSVQIARQIHNTTGTDFAAFEEEIKKDIDKVNFALMWLEVSDVQRQALKTLI